MNFDKLDSDFQAYLKTDHTRWVLGNKVLYDLCDKYPLHTNEEEIIMKIWLIGRSYAAAIERVNKAKNDDKDFYYDKVSPHMMKVGSDLDEVIKSLRGSEHTTKDNLHEILSAHKFLLDQFEEITNMKKRSLASKYLHFHCPNLFYIYDSRSSAKISEYVKLDKSDKSIIDDIKKYDYEYTIFALKAIKLQNHLHEKYGKLLTPREIDNFLLGY